VTAVSDDTAPADSLVDPPVDGRTVARDVVVVLGAFLAAGVLVGIVWPQVVEPVTVTRSEFGLQTGEIALAHRFGHDAWYSLLGGGAALLLGVVLTFWRRAHETATLAALVLGALLAAWVSSTVGTATGPEAAEVVLADAEVGATAPDQVLVTADAAYLAWPLAAVLAAVLVLWAAPTGRGGTRSESQGD
jgi:hypothetical protein